MHVSNRIDVDAARLHISVFGKIPKTLLFIPDDINVVKVIISSLEYFALLPIKHCN